MTQYYSQLTNYGEKYIAAQIGAGKPINLATMAVGDGNGQNTTPTATQTALVHEVYRANTTDVVVDAENPNQVICEFLIPENVGDFWVREIGIFDEKGKLVAVANTPENYKPVLKSGSGKVQYYRIILAVSSSDNIKITLNQNIIFVTRVELDRFKNELSDSDGFRLVGQCNSIEQLRTIEPKENNQRILVKSYYAGGHKGGGKFVSDFNDSTTADNGGTVIVTSKGKRWKRIDDILLPHDFGASENKDQVTLAHGVTRIFGGGNLGQNYKKQTDQFNVPESVVAIGRGSLANAVGAGQTIAIGGNALNKAVHSYSNIAIGETALENLQSSGSEYYEAGKGSRNIAIGGNALQFLMNGTRNVAIGRNAACGLQLAGDCVAIGAGALSGENTNGWKKDVETQVGNSQEDAKITAIGYNSLLYYNGKFSTTLGGQSGTHLKTGDANTLLGFRTGMNLEIDVGWDGFVKTIYGQGDKGLKVDYMKQGNQLTVTIPDHKCVAGSTAYIRWDSGPAFPQPAHWHAWRQKVVAVTNNTVTFECPYDGDGGGKATIFWSLSQNKDANTSRHNTFIGHTAGWQAKKSNNSVIVGSLAGALAEDINNAVVIGFSAGVNAARINNSVLIGSNVSKQTSEVNNHLSIADVVIGDLFTGRIGFHMPLGETPIADLHLRAKGDAGSGRSKTTNGLLVESSQTASIHLDGNNAANLDFEQGGVFKGGLRYSFGNKFMTVVMDGTSSWRFDEEHRFYPVTNDKNSLGTEEKKLKQIFVTTPDINDNSDKATTTKWVDFKLNSHSYAKSRFRHQYYQNHYNGAEVYDIPMADNAVMRVIIMSVSIDGYAKVNLPESFTGYCAVQATDVGRGQKAIGANIQNGNVVEINNSGETALNILAIGWYGW